MPPDAKRPTPEEGSAASTITRTTEITLNGTAAVNDPVLGATTCVVACHGRNCTTRCLVALEVV